MEPASPIPMPNLPYQDHYEVARDAGLERLKQRSDAGRLRRLGAHRREDGAIELASLCWRFAVRLDPFRMEVLPERREANIVWQILVLDYLCHEPAGAPERFLSFADFPQLRSYLKAFEGRVIQRLNQTVGKDKEEFVSAGQRCHGTGGAAEPLSYLFCFFPRFEIQVVRHEGGEEFPPSCNVLFPDNALDLLTAESIIVAAEKLVSSLRGKKPYE